MTKITWKPGTMEYPLPPVMVSCGTMEKSNIMTAAWTGIVSSEPPMTYVSIRPSRYSHELIKESGEFVINLTTLPLVTAADFCGIKSGREVNKFAEMNLTPQACTQVACPQIAESPVSLECKVVNVANYGSHDMFLAEIVAVNVDDKYLDENGKLCLEKAGLIAYSHNYYYTLGRNVGFFGFSVCRSALKAKKKMENVVVEIKEPKIMDKPKERKSSSKFAKRDWKPGGEAGRRPTRDKKFDGKNKFERSRGKDFYADDENKAPRAPRRRFSDDESNGSRPRERRFAEGENNGSRNRGFGERERPSKFGKPGERSSRSRSDNRGKPAGRDFRGGEGKKRFSR